MDLYPPLSHMSQDVYERGLFSPGRQMESSQLSSISMPYQSFQHGFRSTVRLLV